MKIENNIAYFDTDDELTDYVLNVNPTVYQDERTGLYYHDYEFTPQYQDFITNGTLMMVNDVQSKVMKRKCVNRGLITKKLSNLCKWY